jgi:hypothetical protein
MSTNLGGRPQYVPSDADRALVRNMAAAGIRQNAIQRCMPRAPKSDKTFRKVFRTELDTSQDIVSAKAVSKLIGKIDDGDLGAICFWLKCKAGFEERTAHRVVDQDGADRDIKIIVEYEDRPPRSQPAA